METIVLRNPQKKTEQVDSNNDNATVSPNNAVGKGTVRPQKSQRDYVGQTRFPKWSGLANLSRTNRYLGVRTPNKDIYQTLLHNKATPVRASKFRPTLALQQGNTIRRVS